MAHFKVETIPADYLYRAALLDLLFTIGQLSRPQLAAQLNGAGGMQVAAGNPATASRSLLRNVHWQTLGAQADHHHSEEKGGNYQR